MSQASSDSPGVPSGDVGAIFDRDYRDLWRVWLLPGAVVVALFVTMAFVVATPSSDDETDKAMGVATTPDAPAERGQLARAMPVPAPQSLPDPQPQPASPARTVRIDIVTEPAGAAVTVGEVHVGHTPLRAVPAKVDAAGRVRLRFAREGFRPATRWLRVGERDRGRVSVTLDPETSP